MDEVRLWKVHQQRCRGQITTGCRHVQPGLPEWQTAAEFANRLQYVSLPTNAPNGPRAPRATPCLDVVTRAVDCADDSGHPPFAQGTIEVCAGELDGGQLWLRSSCVLSVFECSSLVFPNRGCWSRARTR